MMGSDWLVRRSGRFWVAAAVALIVTAVGVWAQNDSLVGVNYDDGIYALLARSVASGDGYSLTYLPAAVPGVKYPPVYPLSLTPFWVLTTSQESALTLMKLANGLYMGLAAGLFVFLVADLGLLSLPLAAALGLVGFFSGSMMLVTTGLLAEPLFLLLLFCALLAADRLGRRPGFGRLLLVGALAGVVVLTRTVGVAAVAAVVLGVAHRCEGRRWLVVAVAAALLVAPWLAFTLLNADQVPFVLVPRYGSYLQLYLANLAGSPAAAIDILATNVGAIVETAGAKLIPTSSALLRAGAAVLLIGLAALGSRRAFQRAPATALYPWLYLAIVSVWSFPPFRFLFILFPLLLALAAVALVEPLTESEGPRLPAGLRRPARAVIAGLAVAALALLGYREARSVINRVWDGGQLDKSLVAAEVVDWVRANTSRNAVVAFELDPLVALHAGRKAVPNNYEAVHVWYRRGEPSVEILARLVGEMGVDYLAVRRDVPAAAAPVDALFGRYPNSLDLIRVTPRGALIFSVNPAALPGRIDGASATEGAAR